MEKYILAALVSMLPLVELRGGVPIALGMNLPYWPSLLVCTVANMVPVPIIYFFARKVLQWGSGQKYIGKICTFFLEKGESAGRKLTAKAGKGGLFVALMLFVGVPIPGTGAWTGTLAASFLNMGMKSTAASVSLGVAMAAMIMGVASTGVFSIFGI